MDDVFVPSTWSRLVARGLDQCFTLIFYIPFAKTLFQLFFTEEDVYLGFTQLLMLLLIPAIYEAVFLALMQRTPGKWLVGLKVVPASNPQESLSFSQCILRPLVELLSFFFGWAIYALAFLRYDRTHLADWVAETRVVQFTPRAKRTRRRWVLALIFIVMYSFESLNSAGNILNKIDWKNGQINIREVVDPQEFMPEDMEMDI